MLVHFEALLAGMAADLLDLSVGQPFTGEMAQNLMAQEMRVNMLLDASLPLKLFNQLLNATG